MNKLFLWMLFFSLATGGLHAADKTDSGFWEMLRMKIEQLTPQKKLSTTTAVGGVRGAPVEVDDIYWKGEAKPQAIDADELAAFQKALTLGEAGQKEQALAAFAEFSRAYPASALREPADLAVARLQVR